MLDEFDGLYDVRNDEERLADDERQAGRSGPDPATRALGSDCGAYLTATAALSLSPPANPPFLLAVVVVAVNVAAIIAIAV